MSESVDLLVVNLNTLPWLKLLVRQIQKFKPKIAINPMVWDNASSDGSRKWLLSSGIRHFLNPAPGSHSDGLIGLFKMSRAPYVVYLDVDAFPVKEGWLDEAVDAVKGERVGIAGLGAQLPGEPHRPFIHPAFAVFRRELYVAKNLSPQIVHHYSPDIAFDVGEVMCRKLEDEGYALKSLGSEYSYSGQIEHNAVVHARLSWHILANPEFPDDAVRAWVKAHRALLVKFGLLEEFLRYATESVHLNRLCWRYIRTG